jgi:hypothetical protein
MAMQIQTGTGNGAVQQQESHWTPQVIIGAMLASGILGLLGYELITTQSESIHSQIVSILSMGFGSAVTFFLGNMARPRAASGVTVEPPATVSVTDGEAASVADRNAAGNIGVAGR